MLFNSNIIGWHVIYLDDLSFIIKKNNNETKENTHNTHNQIFSFFFSLLFTHTHYTKAKGKLVAHYHSNNTHNQRWYDRRKGSSLTCMTNNLFKEKYHTCVSVLLSSLLLLCLCVCVLGEKKKKRSNCIYCACFLLFNYFFQLRNNTLSR